MRLKTSNKVSSVYNTQVTKTRKSPVNKPFLRVKSSPRDNHYVIDFHRPSGYSGGLFLFDHCGVLVGTADCGGAENSAQHCFLNAPTVLKEIIVTVKPVAVLNMSHQTEHLGRSE